MISTLLDEEQVVKDLLQIDKIPCKINSPFREDKNPSFALFRYKGTIFWKDFSTDETGNVYTLIKRLKGEDAAKDMYRSEPLIKKHKISTITQLACQTRPWRKYDEEYWNSYGVDIELLKKANVKPIARKIVKKGDKEYIFGADKYAYVFEENKDNKKAIKIYQPYNKQFKWTSSFDNSIWSLWTLLPETGDRLIITSSLKDALNLWTNLKIPAVSLQGEGYEPKPQVMKQLKDRFKTIYVFYDNDYNSEDNPGRKYSIKLCDKFGLTRLEIPEEYQAKDPSDLYLKYGREKYLEIMNFILNL